MFTDLVLLWPVARAWEVLCLPHQHSITVDHVQPEYVIHQKQQRLRCVRVIKFWRPLPPGWYECPGCLPYSYKYASARS